MIPPKAFEAYLLHHWLQADVAALLQGLDSEPSVSIRINPRRLPLEAEPLGSDGRVPWCPEGIYLRERPSFTADPLLHAGAYYVQEASSMFLAHALRSLRPTARLALDLCAAPGGKSTLLRSLLPDECLLVSNEPDRARAQVLAENLAKWGHPGVLVTQAHASDLARAVAAGVLSASSTCFDLILADVPCSGEGMMRKEAEAARQWSPALVADCAALQRSIVADIWPALQPGGLLIYSTCTFNPEEDEQNVEWIARELGADVLPIPCDPGWHIRGDLRADVATPLPCCHLLPGEVRGEGFFLAALRKHGTPAEQPPRKKKQKRTAVAAPLTTLPTNQLDSPGSPPAELTLDQALLYLQRQSLTLPPDLPRGIVQACYRGQRLGLMNNLGSRANNLYPKEWRIRSSHLLPSTLFPEL